MLSFNLNLKHTIKTGNESVHCILFTSDKKFLTANEELKINVYSYPNFQKEGELVSHTNIVNYLIEIDGGKVLSCSKDKTIRLWNLKSFTLLKTIEAHTSIVWKVIPLPENRYASCSTDKTIKIWDKEFKVIAGILEHKRPVNSVVLLKNGNLVSGSDDNVLNFWDLDEFAKSFEINNVGTYDMNSMIELENGDLLSGYHNHIYVIDVENKCIKQDIAINKDWGEHFISAILSKGDLLYIGLKGQMGIMDKEYKLCDLKKDLHVYYLFDIKALDDDLIATCSNSGEVKIWETK